VHNHLVSNIRQLVLHQLSPFTAIGASAHGIGMDHLIYIVKHYTCMWEDKLSESPEFAPNPSFLNTLASKPFAFSHLRRVIQGQLAEKKAVNPKKGMGGCRASCEAVKL